jgi:hypothetical protein
MASQVGTTREYSNVDEGVSPRLSQCPQCKVKVLPRGINTTAHSASAGKGSCPNCGHIFGRNELLGSMEVQGIIVSGAGGATTITVDNGTLQMSAAIAPFYAADKTVTWSVVAGTGTATIDADGLLTAVTNGTVTVKATANDGSEKVGEEVITLSNQL